MIQLIYKCKRCNDIIRETPDKRTYRFDSGDLRDSQAPWLLNEDSGVPRIISHNCCCMDKECFGVAELIGIDVVEE